MNHRNPEYYDARNNQGLSNPQCQIVKKRYVGKPMNNTYQYHCEFGGGALSLPVRRGEAGAVWEGGGGGNGPADR